MQLGGGGIRRFWRLRRRRLPSALPPRGGNRLRRRAAGRADDHVLRPGGSLRQVRRRGRRHVHLSADRPVQGRRPDAAEGRGQRSRSSSRTTGYFKNPQITVAVETVPEPEGVHRRRGADARARIPLSGDMNLVEALARAGSTLPTASGEVIIVHPPAADASRARSLPTQDDADEHRPRRPPGPAERRAVAEHGAARRRHHLRAARGERLRVRPGEESRRLRPAAAEHDACCRRCRSPAASPIAARPARIRIVRIVNGEKKELKVKLTDVVQPGDTIIVPERFF